MSVIQLKRTSTPVNTAATLASTHNSATLAAGEMLWSTADNVVEGTGVLYISDGTGNAGGEKPIGGTAYTAMLSPVTEDVETKLKAAVAGQSAAALVLSDAAADNSEKTVTINAPDSVTTSFSINLPDGGGATGNDTIITTNSAGKVPALTSVGTVEGTTLTDGTMSISGGNITAGGAIGADSLNTTGNVVVGGNLTVSGTTTEVSSTTITIDDNLLQLADNYDGANNAHQSGWVTTGSNGSNCVVYGGMVFDNSDQKFKALTHATKPTTKFDNAASAGTLVATIEGNVTGNVTGNVSGTAATVTGAAQAAITSAANLATVGTITTGIWNGTAIANANLANSSVTVNAGDGLSGGGSVSLGGSVALAVGVDDSSIETSSDVLRVKASGVTNTMLAGSIANDKLANSAITINGSSVSLGGTRTLDTDDVGEGSSNQYHTAERVQDVVGAQLVTNGNHTGISFSYDDNVDGAIDATVDGVTLGTNTAGDYVASITAGEGLTSTGATSGETISHSLSVDASQTQITALGTIATGVWNATAIADGKVAGATKWDNAKAEVDGAESTYSTAGKLVEWGADGALVGNSGNWSNSGTIQGTTLSNGTISATGATVSSTGDITLDPAGNDVFISIGDETITINASGITAHAGAGMALTNFVSDGGTI